LALNVGANVWWIHWWGISGAAAATFGAYAIYAIAAGYFSRHLVSIRLVATTVAPAFCASAVPVVICVLTPELAVHAACAVLLLGLAVWGMAGDRLRRLMAARRLEAR
jgi:O-antigen/teichoic acid export membrane protein